MPDTGENPASGSRLPTRRSRRDPRWRRKWLGDWRRVLVENHAHSGVSHELIVVTAPGQDQLPFDRSRCRHDEFVKCSGKHGCRVDLAAADRWNRSAPGRWTALHRAAAQRVRRRFGSFQTVSQVWEPQSRGVLHRNVTVVTSTAADRQKAGYYRQVLAELAPDYGYGFVDRKRRQMSGLHAGRYLAKYLSEGTGKLGIGDLAARDDAPARIAFVGRHLTTSTGSTMRAARERRTVWNLASHLAPIHPDGCSIIEARRVRELVRDHRTAEHQRLSWLIAARRRMRDDDLLTVELWRHKLVKLLGDIEPDRWHQLALDLHPAP